MLKIKRTWLFALYLLFYGVISDLCWNSNRSNILGSNTKFVIPFQLEFIIYVQINKRNEKSVAFMMFYGVYVSFVKGEHQSEKHRLSDLGAFSIFWYWLSLEMHHMGQLLFYDGF